MSEPRPAGWTTASLRPAEPIAAPLSAPSKTHGQENFPVASRLLAPRLRPHVLAFYGFVRAGDDIADDPALSPQAKHVRLDALEAALDASGGNALAAALAASQAETGCGVAEARTLYRAFRQDADKARYADWDDLTAYCDLSAVPVGHFLLALHGENASTHAPSDALCTALQVLNHIQDCAKDRDDIGRIYIPLPWIDAVGGERVFFAPGAAGLRRPVLDALLDRVDDALDRAADLPALIEDRRLRMEAGVTLSLARRLAARLRRDDPVARRVALTARDFAGATLAAPAWRSATVSEGNDRRLVAGRVARARTSFAAAMGTLPARRRAALHAIYAFARAVDDVADAPTPPAERLARLATWREAVARVRAGTPHGPLERELARAAERFDLPLIECDRLVDGMAADCATTVRMPNDLALALYCRRAAGTVGLLSAHVFGLFERPGTRREASRFARALGEALQLINILRDVREDAGENRLYLPLDRLDAARDRQLDAILSSPGVDGVCRSLASRARARIAQAGRDAAALDASALRPALLMLAAYQGLLDAMEARVAAGEIWPLPTRTRLGRRAKLTLAARTLLRARP